MPIAICEKPHNKKLLTEKAETYQSIITNIFFNFMSVLNMLPYRVMHNILKEFFFMDS